MKWAIFIFICLGMIGALVNKPYEANKEDSETSETNSNSDKQPQVESKKLTYEKYMAIQKGMSYRQVISIVGKGEELSSSEMAGYKTEVRIWKGSLGSNMILTFQNNKLIVKAQFGLK